MSWRREYLESEFKDYDYRNPAHPWVFGQEATPEAVRNATWQAHAFHYWWCLDRCQTEAKIGLSIGMPFLPYCLHVAEHAGHLHPRNIVDLYGKSFPLVVGTKAIEEHPCIYDGRCKHQEVIGALRGLCALVEPGGVMIASLLDVRRQSERNFPHDWTPETFYSQVLAPFMRESPALDLEEFNTFKNGVSFNVVIRRTAELHDEQGEAVI